MNLKSFMCMGEELIKGESYFELVKEDTTNYMTAWYMGRIKSRERLKDVTIVKGSYYKNELEQGFAYEATVANSKLRIDVSLDRGDLSIKYKVHLFFTEVGDLIKGIPQIRYRLNVDSKEVKVDVPGGFIKRERKEMAQVALSFMTTDKVGLFSSGLHAYRFD